jgi:hypothetical protein
MVKLPRLGAPNYMYLYPTATPIYVRRSASRPTVVVSTGVIFGPSDKPIASFDACFIDKRFNVIVRKFYSPTPTRVDALNQQYRLVSRYPATAPTMQTLRHWVEFCGQLTTIIVGWSS